MPNEPADLDKVPPLTAHDLSVAQGRRDFLWSLSADYGLSGVLMAVQAIWARLAAPKAARARLMAQRLGLPGTGKNAIRHVLELFIHEMDNLPVRNLPRMEEYPDFDSWNAACLTLFQEADAASNSLIGSYEAILDGRPAASSSAARTSEDH